MAFHFTGNVKHPIPRDVLNYENMGLPLHRQLWAEVIAALYECRERSLKIYLIRNNNVSIKAMCRNVLH